MHKTMPFANTAGFDFGTETQPEWNNRLFLDLDGVMADFTAHFIEKFGVHHNTMSQPELKSKVISHGNFYRHLPLCPGAMEFFLKIQHRNPIILTAVLKDDYFVGAADKRDWVHETLSPELLVLPAYGSSSKHLYLQRPGDVLIDDWDPNIRRWTECGGIGIHHRGDFDSTYNTLMEIVSKAA